jgi:hypothetical protein
MLITNIRLDYNSNRSREWTITAVDASDNQSSNLSDVLGREVDFVIRDNIIPHTPWPRSSNVPVIRGHRSSNVPNMPNIPSAPVTRPEYIIDYGHRNLYNEDDYNKLMHTTDLSIDEDSFLELEKKEVKEEPKRVVVNGIDETEI